MGVTARARRVGASALLAEVRCHDDRTEEDSSHIARQRGEVRMRLSEFIDQHHEKILEEWVRFARTVHPWSKDTSDRELRDHAKELLTAVVSDMKSPQSGHEQSEKSKGRTDGGELGAIGQRHAAERLKSGFRLDQLFAEYRALRASVLRLWAAQGDKDGEITRFNEAIDETLAEGATSYAAELNETRDQFLAILGHDLRNPLAAIFMGAAALTRSEQLDDKHSRAAQRIVSSAGRMQRMINDLLDLTRTRLGAGIPITRTATDLALVCEQVVDELHAVCPDRVLQLEVGGPLIGAWDGDRLTQLISNIVANALQYGDVDSPVRIVALANGADAVVRVHNNGPAIPEETIKKIFEPMVRQPARGGARNAGGLGLGLYIAREVAAAHGGRIDVTSTNDDGTTFIVTLPRHLDLAPAPIDNARSLH